MVTAGQRDWSRSKYPLQAPSKGSALSSQTIFTLKDVNTSSLDRQPKKAPGAGSYPWYLAVTDDQTKQLDNDSSAPSHQSVEDSQTFDESSTLFSMSQRSITPTSVVHDSQSQSGEAEGISSPVQFSKSVQNGHVSSLWARDSYPLHPATANSSRLHSPAPEESYEERLPVHTQPRTLRRTPRSRRIDSVTSLTNTEEASTTDEMSELEQSTDILESNPWQRKGYPLQSAASGSMALNQASPPSEKASMEVNPSVLTQVKAHHDVPPAGTSQEQQSHQPQSYNTNSTGLPASPPLSENGSQGGVETPIHRSQDLLSPQETKSSKPLRNRKYPLQAPASTTNLRRSATPPPTHESTNEHAGKNSTDQPQEKAQVITKSKTLRRQGYPLQSPASIVNLRSSPTPPPSPPRSLEHTDKISADQPQEDEKASTTTQTFSRQGYPLQSAASVSSLQVPPLEAKKEPEISSKSIVNQSQDNKNVNTESNKGPTQVYPLQPPISVPALRVSPPVVEVESEDGTKSSAEQSRENEIAAKVINQWRRQVYPVQSPKNIPPFLRSPTPQPPEQRVSKPSKIHLPKNIRAVTDAEGEHAKGRTIVVCLDGTGDKFDDDNSNIVHIISALKKDDQHQVTYYQAGIGTYSEGGLSNGIAASLDMAVGSGLGLHVRDAYQFLMHSYKEGDKICIFGFSRGAYTARCLAGMIHKVGLLPPRNIQQIQFAYQFYADDTPLGWKRSIDFKRTFSIDVNVHFLGCFDSVASVGFIPRQLPLASTPTSKPRYFRHAMALDERRAKFKICRHQTKHWEDINKGQNSTDPGAATASSVHAHHNLHYKHHSLSRHKDQLDAPPPEYTERLKHEMKQHPGVSDEEYEDISGHEVPFDTDVHEVWFAGAHADVGGGAVANAERHKLAQIPLRWMIRQAFECNTGIIFKTKILAEHGLDVHTLWPKYEKLTAPTQGPPPSMLEKYEDGLPPRHIRKGKLVPIDKYDKGEAFYHLKGPDDEDWTPEQVEDFFDAMSPINDQLIQAPNWWILEFLPVQYKVPRAAGDVEVRTGMNLGRYRGVEDVEPNLHWTVLQRIEQLGYKINARTAPHTNWRTVV